ncbi:hypothetical protein LOAG_12215, partial [Loa loa]
FQTILYIAFIIKTTTAIGGIFGLKAATGDIPHIGFGNPWITQPQFAHAGLPHSPYPLWGYGNRGIYYPYYPYLQFLQQPTSRFWSSRHHFHRGGGFPWMIHG